MRGDRRRLQIVHESLLTHWPRLVRWRAQDEEGAVLRDQLRQAAHLWDQRGRAGDFLWTGTAYREYQLWRERYPGGLSALEEQFAGAMTALAQRRRRGRRIAIAAGFAVLTTVLAVVAVLRQRAVGEARRAEAEAVRAEASKVLALGQVELQASPTIALAYAIKSLEMHDSPAARVFALKALAAGPPGLLYPVKIRETSAVNQIVFSPDGAWAAVLGDDKLHVVSRDGGSRRFLEPFPSGTGWLAAVFDAGSEHLYAAKDGLVRVWSVPAFALLETQTIGGTYTHLRRAGAQVLAATRVKDVPRQVDIAAISAGRKPRQIERLEGITSWSVDSAGVSLAVARGKALYVRALEGTTRPPRRVGTYGGQPRLLFHPNGELLAAFDDASRDIRLWAANRPASGPTRVLALPFEPLAQFTFDGSGRRLAAIGATPKGLRVDLWDLHAPVDAAPSTFPAAFGGFLSGATFSPDGRWLATANFHAVCFWPLETTEPRSLVGHGNRVVDVRFTPDGGRLVSVDTGGDVREWQLGAGGASRTLATADNSGVLDMDRRGRFVAVAQRGGALIVPLQQGEQRALTGFSPATRVGAVAIDAAGRRVAAAGGSGPRHDKVIRVWDLETDDVWTLGPFEQAGDGTSGQTLGLGFLADGSLISSGDGGLRRWSVPDGTHEVLAPSFVQSHLTVFADGKSVAYVAANQDGARPGSPPVAAVSLAIAELGTRKTRIVRSHGGRLMPVGVNPSGTAVVSGGLDGIVRVGPVTGEQPHLLIGHEGFVHTVDVSPDGRWVAAGGDDRAIHIWPMPDLSKPPLQALPREEVLARLKSLTNVRVVEDSASTISAWLRTERGSGYEIDILPFPGWAEARPR